MNRRSLLCGFPGLALPPLSGWCEPPAADRILEQVRDRPDGRDAYSNVSLLLTDADGGRRERHLVYLQKKYGRAERLTLLFTGPADVKGVGLQSLNHDEADGRPDEQWIYLPAFRQVRRIAANDKRGAFMGSQFAYVDLDRLRVSDYRQALAGQDQALDRDCHVIERLPASDEVVNRAGYHKLRAWVDKETHIILRQAYYDAGGLLFKQYDAKRLEKIQGIWTVVEGVMVDRVNKRSSTLSFSDVRYDLGLGDELFQQDILKTGIRHGNLPAFR